MNALGALEPFVVPLCGGLAIGTLSLGKLALSGKVLGISGAVKGLVVGDRALWRYSFIAGLIAGGFALVNYFPSAFDPASTLAALPLSRIITAGFLVGSGTFLGNGCTSGHGICGNARFSLRSLTATLTFMAFGAAAGGLFHTAALQGVQPGLIIPPPPSTSAVTFATSVLGSSLALVSGLALMAKNIRATWLELAADFGTGVLFALGLGAAGMTMPTKVSSFLGVFAGTFDPSLAFVMGGALLVATPGYQLIMRTKVLPHPLLATASTFNLPTSKTIDWKLLGGAALFGTGWGLAGLCPGPALVSVATLQVPSIVFVASLVAGMVVAQKVEQLAG